MDHIQSGMAPEPFLLDIFQKLDRDRSGTINADELQIALTNGTWSPFNRATVRLMIVMFDRHSRGEITFDDFGALWKFIIDWEICFKSFDKDQSGTIDRNEMQAGLTSIGYRLSQPVVDALLIKYDRHASGQILFDDFIQCLVILQTLTNLFRSCDTDQKGVITIDYEKFLSMALSVKI